MAVVFFSGELQELVGEEETRSEASIFIDIVKDLTRRYENLNEGMLLEMAVAIDGEIIHTPLLEPISVNSELHFLHRISGG